MVTQKRWFLKKETNLDKFIQVAKSCKEFNLDAQKKMLKFIMESKLDKVIIPGVKRRRIRKKYLKKEIKNLKLNLTYQMLNMMEEKWIDFPKDMSLKEINARDEKILKDLKR